MASPDSSIMIPSGPDCVELHRAEALALPAARVRTSFDLPLRVVVEEGHDTGEYARRYYASSERVPGFDKVSFRVPAETPKRLLTLAAAAREMCYVVTVGRGNTSLRAVFQDGEKVLQRLTDDLGFWLDDGVDTDDDAAYAALKDEHDDTLSIDRLSAALYDFARMGESLGSAMLAAGMETWDPTLPAQALKLRDTLSTPVPPPDRADLDLRNRLLSILQAEVGVVRRTAAYLWARNHRDVYGLFASAWLRNKNLAAKRRAAKASETPDDALF
ncbi:MAG: hypothetical protein AMXMBFR64_48960 [Myxococcales bacterium]